MNLPTKHFYEFGAFRLDTDERILLREGQLVSLTPKSYETLLVLVKNSGRIIDKEELLDKIWPDTIVEEVSLAKMISLLRKTLGEDFRHSYIETVPRRGYRFVAEVREVCQENGAQMTSSHQRADMNDAIEQNGLRAPETSTPHQIAVRRAWMWNRWIWSTALLALGSIAGFLVWQMVSRSHLKTSAPTLKTFPLTSYQGQENQVAFSPDGKQVAFLWNGPRGDNPDIYVKLIDAETPLRLTTDSAADVTPVWSPDGRHLVFLRQYTDRSVYYLIPVLGGAERKLAEVFPYNVPIAGNSPYFSPDGKYLAISDKHSAAEPLSLFLLSIETGEKRKLTTPPGGTGDFYPAFSPNGKMLAFVRSTSLTTNDLYLMSLPSGELRQLTFDNATIAGVAWTADSREIVFSSRKGSSFFHLWRIAISGGEPERIEAVGKRILSPAISPDGNRLAYTQNLGDDNIWRFEINDGGRVKTKTSLIASTSFDYGPDYSPDGRKIVFTSGRTGGHGIWICEADGSKPRLLIDCGPYVSGTPRWSPDGRWIVFDSCMNPMGAVGNPDIYIISAEGGQPRRLTNDPAEDVAPSWSRDGRWVYFGSSRSGSIQLWKVPIAGGPEAQITKQGGFEAFESPDGDSLYYTRGRGIPGIWRVATEGGKEEPVLDHHQVGLWRYWRVVERGIYFASSTETGSLLEFFNFATGRVNEVSRLAGGPERNAPGLAVSPDGHTLLFVQLDRWGSDLMIAENFR